VAMERFYEFRADRSRRAAALISAESLITLAR